MSCGHETLPVNSFARRFSQARSTTTILPWPSTTRRSSLIPSSARPSHSHRRAPRRTPTTCSIQLLLAVALKGWWQKLRGSAASTRSECMVSYRASIHCSYLRHVATHGLSAHLSVSLRCYRAQRHRATDFFADYDKLRTNAVPFKKVRLALPAPVLISEAGRFCTLCICFDGAKNPRHVPHDFAFSLSRDFR